MKLFLFSHPLLKEKELDILSNLEDNVLDAFHLRKPGWTAIELEKFLGKLPRWIREKTVLHQSFHLSSEIPVKGIHLTEKNRAKFLNNQLDISDQMQLVSSSYHSLLHLLGDKLTLEYAFLSPIFDSISKANYGSAFDFSHLKGVIPKVKKNVVALGGIDTTNIRICQDIGFYGVGALGSVWLSPNPLAAIHALKSQTDQYQPC
ncbi:MAG: thiamine phosphate synthase [Bacteroidota bacterium]